MPRPPLAPSDTWCDVGQHQVRWKHLDGRQHRDGSWQTVCYRCEGREAMLAAGVAKPVKGIDCE